MYNCPICKEPGIPAWRKAFLGPGYPTKCKKCGKKVGTSYKSLLLGLPGGILIFIITYNVLITGSSVFWIILTGIIGSIIAAIMQLKWVSLISKE